MTSASVVGGLYLLLTQTPTTAKKIRLGDNSSFNLSDPFFPFLLLKIQWL